MKNIKELLNLPVVSLKDGEEIGNIKTTYVNCDKKTVEYIVIQNNDSDTIKVEVVIPYLHLSSVGNYAATLESLSSVMDIKLLQFDDKKYKKQDDIISQVIITDTGDYVGKTYGFDFDEKTGEIESLLFDDAADNSSAISKEDIITLGHKLIIVKKNSNLTIVKKDLEERASNKNNNIEIEFPKDALVEDTEENYNSVKKKYLQSKLYDMYPEEQKAEYTSTGKVDLDEFVSNREKKVLGQKTTQDLIGLNGEVVVYKGTELTEELIKKVKEMDENLFYELLATV